MKKENVAKDTVHIAVSVSGHHEIQYDQVQKDQQKGENGIADDLEKT